MCIRDRLKLSAPDRGRLHTFSRDGEVRATRMVTVGEQDFLHDATHAVDRDGTIYLAAGREVIAFPPLGAPLWRQPIDARVSRGAPVLSPFGDLYVITDGNELLALAAGSPGEARTGWPTARGGARNRNAR